MPDIETSSQRRVHAPKASRAKRCATTESEPEYVDPRPSAVVAEWSWRAATVLRDNRRSTFQG